MVFTVEVDNELVDKTQLESWLDISGRRIGLCDWRPEKSGSFGRFATESIKEVLRLGAGLGGRTAWRGKARRGRAWRGNRGEAWRGLGLAVRGSAWLCRGGAMAGESGRGHGHGEERHGRARHGKA